MRSTTLFRFVSPSSLPPLLLPSPAVIDGIIGVKIKVGSSILMSFIHDMRKALLSQPTIFSTIFYAFTDGGWTKKHPFSAILPAYN